MAWQTLNYSGWGFLVGLIALMYFSLNFTKYAREVVDAGGNRSLTVCWPVVRCFSDGHSAGKLVGQREGARALARHAQHFKISSLDALEDDAESINVKKVLADLDRRGKSLKCPRGEPSWSFWAGWALISPARWRRASGPRR